jgi:hypothetical protein
MTFTQVGCYSVSLSINGGTPVEFPNYFRVVTMNNSNQSRDVENNWATGAEDILNFSPGPNVQPVLPNSTFAPNEGLSAISNSDGQLLFYTDGNYVFNRHHEIMPNGSLGGDPSAQQGVLILPMPGDCANFDQYYIFYKSNANMVYTVVDMSADNGLGDIDITNYPVPVLMASPTQEAITATPMCDGSGYWLLMHEHHSDKFTALKFDASGVDLASPVHTHIGVTTAPGFVNLRIDPTGSWVAMTHLDASLPVGDVYLFEFDRTTGDVLNPHTMDPYVTGTTSGFYGLEFSPNGEMLYLAPDNNTNNHIVRYDLNSPQPHTYNVATLNATGQETWGVKSLELAADGNIYFNYRGEVTSFGVPYHIGVIEDPNDAGAIFSNVDTRRVPMGRPYFLPSMLNNGVVGKSYFYQQDVVIRTPRELDLCSGGGTSVVIESDFSLSGPVSYEWYSLEDGLLAGQNGPNLMVTTGGVYMLVVTHNDCIYKAITTVHQNEKGEIGFTYPSYFQDPELQNGELVESVTDPNCNSSNLSQFECAIYSLWKYPNNKYCLVKHTVAGAIDWLRKYEYSSTESMNPINLHFGDNELFVVSDRDQGFYISKFDLSGNEQWSQHYYLSANVNTDEFNAVASDNSGSNLVVLADYKTGGASNYTQVVVEIDNTGAIAKSETWQPSASHPVQGIFYEAVDIEMAHKNQILLKSYDPSWATVFNNMVVIRNTTHGDKYSFQTYFSNNEEFHPVSFGNSGTMADVIGHTGMFTSNANDFFLIDFTPSLYSFTLNSATLYNHDFTTGNLDMRAVSRLNRITSSHAVSKSLSGGNQELNIFPLDGVGASFAFDNSYLQNFDEHIGRRLNVVARSGAPELYLTHQLDYPSINQYGLPTLSTMSLAGSATCETELEMDDQPFDLYIDENWDGYNEWESVEVEILDVGTIGVLESDVEDFGFCCELVPESLPCDFTLDFDFDVPCGSDEIIITGVNSDEDIAGATFDWKLNGISMSSDQTPTFTGLTPGIHEVCLTMTLDDDGYPCTVTICKSIQSGVITEVENIVTCLNPYFYKPFGCGDPYDSYQLIDHDPTDNMWHDYNYNSGSGCSGWIHHGLIPGTYTFNFFDAAGCLLKTLTVNIIPGVNPQHQLNFFLCEPDVCIYIDVNDPSFPCSPHQGFISAEFFDGTNLISVPAVNGVVQFCGIGSYKIVVDNGNDCTCEVTGFISPCPTEMPQNSSTGSRGDLNDLGFEVYPNPSDGTFHLDLKHLQKVNIMVKSQDGATVYSETLENTAHHDIDLSGKSSGVYTLIIEANGKQSIKKITLIK